jgi:hypothetical protein
MRFEPDASAASAPRPRAASADQHRLVRPQDRDRRTIGRREPDDAAKPGALAKPRQDLAQQLGPLSCPSGVVSSVCMRANTSGETLREKCAVTAGESFVRSADRTVSTPEIRHRIMLRGGVRTSRRRATRTAHRRPAGTGRLDLACGSSWSAFSSSRRNRAISSSAEKPSTSGSSRQPTERISDSDFGWDAIAMTGLPHRIAFTTLWNRLAIRCQSPGSATRARRPSQRARQQAISASAGSARKPCA